MSFKKMDLNLFLVFDVIYSEGNLTRAAEVLNITQPAVSNALARMRLTFDDQLFVRSGRAMIPTPVARNLIAPVRQSLKQLRESFEQRGTFDPKTSNKIFTVVAGDVVSSVLIPELMNRLKVEAPFVRIQCYQMDRKEIHVELAAGRADFAIEIPLLPGTGLNQMKLLEEEYVCVLRKDHPDAKGEILLDRFLSLNHLMVSQRRKGLSFIEIALKRQGKKIRPTLRVQDYLTAFNSVLTSNLALAAPRSLANNYDVFIHELPFVVPRLETVLYWHGNVDNDSANKWMREILALVGNDIMGRSRGKVQASQARRKQP